MVISVIVVCVEIHIDYSKFRKIGIEKYGPKTTRRKSEMEAKGNWTLERVFLAIGVLVLAAEFCYTVVDRQNWLLKVTKASFQIDTNKIIETGLRIWIPVIGFLILCSIVHKLCSIVHKWGPKVRYLVINLQIESIRK